MVQASDQGAELRQDQQGRARGTVARQMREKSTVVKLGDEVDPISRDRKSPALVCLANGTPELDRGRCSRQPWGDRRFDGREMALDIQLERDASVQRMK